MYYGRIGANTKARLEQPELITCACQPQVLPRSDTPICGLFQYSSRSRSRIALHFRKNASWEKGNQLYMRTGSFVFEKNAGRMLQAGGISFTRTGCYMKKNSRGGGRNQLHENWILQEENFEGGGISFMRTGCFKKKT